MPGYFPTHVVDVLSTDLDGAQSTPAAGVVAAVSRQRGGGRGAGGYRFDESATPVTIRLPHGTPCAQGDQIRDTVTGRLWLVDTADSNHNPAMAADVIATCRDLDGGA